MSFLGSGIAMILPLFQMLENIPFFYISWNKCVINSINFACNFLRISNSVEGFGWTRTSVCPLLKNGFNLVGRDVTVESSVCHFVDTKTVFLVFYFPLFKLFIVFIIVPICCNRVDYIIDELFSLSRIRLRIRAIEVKDLDILYRSLSLLNLSYIFKRRIFLFNSELYYYFNYLLRTVEHSSFYQATRFLLALISIVGIALLADWVNVVVVQFTFVKLIFSSD